jgi:hypothetical protein
MDYFEENRDFIALKYFNLIDLDNANSIGSQEWKEIMSDLKVSLVDSDSESFIEILRFENLI